MRMQRNKKRQPIPPTQQLPASKKRKVEQNKFYEVFQGQEEAEKRKAPEIPEPTAKRFRLDDEQRPGEKEACDHHGGETKDQTHHEAGDEVQEELLAQPAGDDQSHHYHGQEQEEKKGGTEMKKNNPCLEKVHKMDHGKRWRSMNLNMNAT